jgi:outer membrane protein assembly factor BamB
MNLSTILATAAVTLTFLSHSSASEWPNWRGPNFNGTAGSDEKGLPVKFSPTEGVAWAVDLPGPAASTPAIWGDSVFLSVAVESEQKLYAMCLDRKTGTVRWKHAVGDGFRSDDKSNFASPSPVTDGKLAIFFYGTGDVAAYDFSGKEVWKKNLMKDHGRFATQWTYSSSPMLVDNRLIFQVLQRNEAFVFAKTQKGEPDGKNESYILALEPATGKQLWKSIRPSEAVMESLEAFSTPVPFEHNGRKELLIVGGDCMTGCDPASGKELWRWGTWNPKKIGHWRHVVSPVAAEGIVLVCAPKKEPVYAIKLGGKGGMAAEAIAWQSGEDASKEVSSDVSTPAYYQGRFYIVNSDRQSVSCVEPKTGKVFWDERMDGQGVRLQKFESSPTIADGKLYVMDHRGTVVVLQTGDEFKQLAVNPMGADNQQNIRSTVAVSAGQLFIRTNSTIYCVGKK